ncbi:MAG: Eco57I restriction-modification methylase domain-containing protein [Candidatus Odinarchaeota archaeon]
MEKQKKFEEFKKFIGSSDKSIDNNNFQGIRSLFPLIESFEDYFLSGYHKRKKEGTFYTDKKISDFIVIETLLCIVNKKLNESTQNTRFIENFDKILNLDNNIKKEIIELLLNITICDPACGSGGFLLSAASVIYNTILKLNYEMSKSQIKKKILNNLYGFDINEYAIKLCMIKLLRWYDNEENTSMQELISILKSNLQIQNSIINSQFPKFDIIIGNPPYGNILKQKEKELLKKEDVFFKDIYCAFLIKALRWSNELVGFLIPKSFLLRQGYINFRNKFLSKANILKIIDVGSKMFANATNEVQIILYENKKDSFVKDLTIFTYPKKKIITYQNQNVDTLRICINSTCPLNVLTKKLYVYTFLDNCPFCSSATVLLNRIRIKSNKSVYTLLDKIERTGDLNYLNPVDFPKMIRGEEDNGLKLVRKKIMGVPNGSCFFISARNDFNYYFFSKTKSFNIYELNSDVLKGNDYEYYIGPKLLIKHNNIIPQALYTEENVCFTSSVYSLLHDKINELKFLCGIINSSLIQFYCTYAINNQKDTTINLNQYMIRHLPIVRTSNGIKLKIVKTVEKINILFEELNGVPNNNVLDLLRNLDHIIFNLYSLSEQEINLIISKVKNQTILFNMIYEN